MVDHFPGIAGALVLITSVLAILMAVGQRRWRAIKLAGYTEVEIANPVLKVLTETLFALSPREIHRNDKGGGKSWLVFIDTRDSESPDLAMLAYRLNRDYRPKVVLIQSGRRIPKFVRRLEGGMFKWAEPTSVSELTGLTGSGRFAFKELGLDIPSAVKEFFTAVVQIPHPSRLYGVAVAEQYLVVWTDAWRVGSLLATAPLVRKAFPAATS